MRDLDINRPAWGLDEEFPTVSIEDSEVVEGEEASNRRPPKKLHLSREQCRLLEASFRQNQMLNLVRKINIC